MEKSTAKEGNESNEVLTDILLSTDNHEGKNSELQQSEQDLPKHPSNQKKGNTCPYNLKKSK